MEKLSLAICGLGRFAKRRILPALTSCQGVELIAVVGRSMKDYQLASNIQRFNSLEDYLGTSPRGAIYIATPNYLHAQQTSQCLEAGLHVLCEKPMATNFDDCQSMVKIARKMKKHLKIGHMLRYSPALLLARSWLQNGIIGEPQEISAFFHYELPEENRPWAYRKDLAGGGVLLDAGIHCIDTIRFLVGDPIELLDAVTDQFQTDSVEKSAACKFTASGINCYIQVCSKAPYFTHLSISGTSGEIVIDNFTACWDKISVKHFARQPDNARLLIKEEIVDVSGTYSDQIRDFENTVKQTDICFTTDLEAAENVRIVENLYAINHCR